MKKRYSLFGLMLFFVIVTACSVDEGEDSTDSKKALLNKGTSSQPKVEGVNDVDVVNLHGGIKGLERAELFYEATKEGQADDLRIVHYTIEGDPIVTDVAFDGETYQMEIDSTRDAFGSGEVLSGKCETIIREDNLANLSFIAAECSGDLDKINGLYEILQVDYNLRAQDRFEFELKYGVEYENEINTMTHTIKQQISADELHVKDGVFFSENVMQEIYKRLVLANYLQEKEFKIDCELEDALKYRLTVYINSGERVHQWSACDESSAGEAFTHIAAYIIAQSEKQFSAASVTTTLQGYVLETKENALLLGEAMNKYDYTIFSVFTPEEDKYNNGLNYVWLEGVDSENYMPGDKVQAIIEGSIDEQKPGRATVQEIKKIDPKEEAS